MLVAIECAEAFYFEAKMLMRGRFEFVKKLGCREEQSSWNSACKDQDYRRTYVIVIIILQVLVCLP